MSPEWFGILLAFLASFATAVGASFIFFLKPDRTVLASCIAVAAGAMIYVSFIEIFPEARVMILNDFTHRFPHLTEYSVDKYSYGLTVLGFFIGWFFGFILRIISDFIIKVFKLETYVTHDWNENSPSLADLHDELIYCKNSYSQLSHSVYNIHDTRIVENTNSKSSPLFRWFKGFIPSAQTQTQINDQILEGIGSKHLDKCQNELDSDANTEMINANMNHIEKLRDYIAIKSFQYDCSKYLKIGIFTALTITLHNFPEGFATYIGAFTDGPSKYTLAIAIGIHNIPEGFSIAMPLYMALNNKKLAFLYGSLSGFAELFGAVFAFFLMNGKEPGYILGCIFAMVAGLMANIGVTELLPSCFRYNPRGTVTIRGFLAGMFIMALSLVLIRW